jgi:thioredoxin 1
MSDHPKFDASQKGILVAGGVTVIVLALIAYFAWRGGHLSGGAGSVSHVLPQVRANGFESEVLKADKPVLVDFYADWCGPCKMMEPVLAEFARETTSVKVVQVNVDDESGLAREYDINAIPALLLFNKGELIDRSLGVRSKDALKSMIERLGETTVPTPAVRPAAEEPATSPAGPTGTQPPVNRSEPEPALGSDHGTNPP